MKRYILLFFLSVVVTLVVFSSHVFIPGIEIFLLPVMLLLYCIGITGIMALLYTFHRFYKRRKVSNSLKYVVITAAGFYLGLVLNKPISKWDEGQRNLGGQILSYEIEGYKLENGVYPESLSALDEEKFTQSLPENYHITRFSYHIKADDYDLDILIPIMDRWHWNAETRVFEYDDF